MRYVTAVLCIAVCAMAIPARAFDFSDARHLVALSQPQISPDGRRVVFVRGRPNYDTDAVDRQLVLVDVASRGERQLTWDRKGVSDPAWSADGSAIAFLALDNEKEPKAQIYVLPMDGGDARQITHAENGVNGYAWSPNGRTFAYTMQDDNPDKARIARHLDAFEVHDNDYLHRAATPPVHVWLCDADGSHARRITNGPWSVADVDPDGGGDLSWSPDSKTLAIEHFPTPFVGDSLGVYVELIDVRSGAAHPLVAGEKLSQSQLFAPHGNAIAYQRNTRGDYTQGVDLYVTDASGKRLADLRDQLDRNVDFATWNARGDALWVGVPDRTSAALYYWPIHGRISRVGMGELEPNALGNSANDGTLVFVAAAYDRAPEIYVLRSPHSAPVVLTHENDFARRAGLAKEVGVTWRATKGTFEEDGVLVEPLSFDKLRTTERKFPLILLIHGGPQGASTLGWSTQAQIFAAHGFYVFEPNYRGSTNLGDAYQHAIANDNGDGPGKDVMAGLAAVERTFPVDTARIGVSGWSYGGYMTSWLIGHYQVWKAAVSGASLDDWLDDYDIAFYYDTDVPFFRGKPWNPANTAQWRAQSPIAYAPQATTPTLIMGDIGDNNVTITNSFKLYHALKDNGTTVKFIAYPIAGHFPRDPVRMEDVLKNWLGWLEQYLK